MKKILIATNKFVSGGVETTLLNILKNIDKTEFDITLGLVCKGGELEKSIPKNIKIIYFLPFDPMGLNKCLSNIYQAVLLLCPRYLTNIFFLKRRKFDTAVAYSGNTIYYLKGFKNKKICWIHDDWFPLKIQNHFFGRIRKKKTLKYLSECYKINCVSNNLKTMLYSFSNNKLNNIQFLANPVDVSKIKKMSSEKINLELNHKKITFISVGRLHNIKGYDRLIDICINLEKDYKNFELIIVGDGEERENLQRKITSHNASSYIKLVGYSSNPYKYMANADMYICSSIMEGYSTTVSEAMIIGLGIISTDCGGSDQILDNGKYGILTENNSKSLEDGIKIILDNNDLIDYYSKLSKKRAKILFDLDKSMKSITDFL